MKIRIEVDHKENPKAASAVAKDILYDLMDRFPEASAKNISTKFGSVLELVA